MSAPMGKSHIGVTPAHILAARTLVESAPELGEAVSPLIRRIASMPLPGDPVVPVAVLRNLADEFDLRGRSGQIANTEAEGDAMRIAWHAAAHEIRQRIPR